MAVPLKISRELMNLFPDLRVLIAHVDGVRIKKEDPELEKFKEEVAKEVKSNYEIESLKNLPIFRAYRNFFWSIGIDPTKIRPASEALIRRILRGKGIPKINTLVDSYNLASIKTGIAIAAFDEDKLDGDLVMRRALKGEKFFGIGMKEPIELKGDEVVVSDESRLIAVYPYRDADHSKVTESTKKVLLMICGVPRISRDYLMEAGETAIEFVTKFCGGKGFIEE